MNKFSVLIANYNNGRYFKDCYQSLIAQDYPNWEAIIVDDCSTDNSIAIIEQLIKDDSRFKLHKSPVNKGVGFTKRLAAELATGDILAVLDPDDGLKRGAISKLVSTFEQHPDAVGVCTRFINCDADLKPEVKLNEFTKAPPVNYPFQYLESGLDTIHHFFAFKRDAYKKTVGIDPTLRNADDIDLYIKMEEMGNIYRLEDYLHLYRQAPGSLSNYGNAASSWIWVMRSLYRNAVRRIQKRSWTYKSYSIFIMERFINTLRQAKLLRDQATFKTLKRDFFKEPLNRKLFFSSAFYKYFIRHFREFMWTD